MNLATFQDGARDGQLLVVSRNLHGARFATAIASRLQRLLGGQRVAPRLRCRDARFAGVNALPP